MDYFSQLKLEQTNLLNHLLEDAKYLRDAVQANDHHYDSIDVLCRLIEINRNQIAGYEEKTYDNWQKLTELHQTIRAIENSLTFSSFRIKDYKERPDGYPFIDQLCTEILQRSGLNSDTFGHFVVCGGDNYQHTHPMNIIHCRLTDYYRLFHLGLMAHEFGHHFIYSFFDPIPIINYNPFDENNIPDPEKVFDNWKVEVASDIFGSLIMGPSMMTSHAFMPDYWLFQSNVESEFLYKFRIHPPCEIRFNLHKEVLTALDVPFDTPIPDLFDFGNQVILTGETINGEDYADRLEDTPKFLEMFYPDFEELHGIIKRNVDPFTPEDWEKSLEFSDKFLEKDLRGLDRYSAIQIVNGVTAVKNEFTSHEEEADSLAHLIDSFNLLL